MGTHALPILRGCLRDQNCDAAATAAGKDGDPVKMQNLMLEAQTDPESFLNSLSSDLKEKIKNIANELDKNQASEQRP